MTILVDWQLDELVMNQKAAGEPLLIDPFFSDKVTDEHGVSFGLGTASYDLRLGREFILRPGADPVVRDALILFPGEYALATTVETVHLPDNITGFILDKSTWARRGVTVQNTLIDPGFNGQITLEISNHSKVAATIPVHVGICQIVFHHHAVAARPYKGKYQGQIGVTGPKGGGL